MGPQVRSSGSPRDLYNGMMRIYESYLVGLRSDCEAPIAAGRPWDAEIGHQDVQFRREGTKGVEWKESGSMQCEGY